MADRPPPRCTRMADWPPPRYTRMADWPPPGCTTKILKSIKRLTKRRSCWMSLERSWGWQVGTNLISIYYYLYLGLSRVIFYMYCACVFGAMHLSFIWFLCLWIFAELYGHLGSSGKKVIRALYGVHLYKMYMSFCSELFLIFL